MFCKARRTFSTFLPRTWHTVLSSLALHLYVSPAMSGFGFIARTAIMLSRVSGGRALIRSLTITVLFGFSLMMCLVRNRPHLAIRTPSHQYTMSMLGTFSEVTNNETFGFAKTFLINLPTRYDYLDAATIQAFLSGVQFEVFPAVEGDVVREKGMPPTHHKQRLTQAEKGCWRSHANVIHS